MTRNDRSYTFDNRVVFNSIQFKLYAGREALKWPQAS